MEKFLAIDRHDANYQKSSERAHRLKEQIAKAKANPTGIGPLQAFDIAKAVNREADYRALYKVYSKMTHATAWAIFGACSWGNMALLLLLKANGYAAECIKRIARKSGLPANTPLPKV